MPKRKTDADMDTMYHTSKVFPYTRGSLFSREYQNIPTSEMLKLSKLAPHRIMQMVVDAENAIRDNERMRLESNPQYWQYGYVKG